MAARAIGQRVDFILDDAWAGYRKTLDAVWRPPIGEDSFEKVKYSALVKIADAKKFKKKTRYGGGNGPRHFRVVNSRCIRIGDQYPRMPQHERGLFPLISGNSFYADFNSHELPTE